MLNERNISPRRIVVVAVPGTRRVRSLSDAARRLRFDRFEVVSYLDLIAGNYPPPSNGTLIRIESPSECSATTREILKAGIIPMAAIGETPLAELEINRLACDRGEMLKPRQWYFGYRAV